MTMRCAIWARVSTDEQDTGNQVAELRQWADHRGFEITTEYILEGTSAWNGKHREQLREALAGARARKFDVMLVWALDRLSREGIEATLSIMRRFSAESVPVWSLKESWTETSDPHVRELIAAIMAWVAESESRRRSERTKAGLARKMREDPDFKPGRQPGAKDKTKRKRSGYVARYENRGTSK